MSSCRQAVIKLSSSCHQAVVKLSYRVQILHGSLYQYNVGTRAIAASKLEVQFLAPSELLKWRCRSVGLSVGLSVGPWKKIQNQRYELIHWYFVYKLNKLLWNLGKRSLYNPKCQSDYGSVYLSVCMSVKNILHNRNATLFRNVHGRSL